MHADAVRLVLAWLPQANRLAMLLDAPADAPWRPMLIDAAPWEWDGYDLHCASMRLAPHEISAIIAQTTHCNLPDVLAPQLPMFGKLVCLDIAELAPRMLPAIETLGRLRALRVMRIILAGETSFPAFSLPPNVARVWVPPWLLLEVCTPPQRLRNVMLKNLCLTDATTDRLFDRFGQWPSLRRVWIEDGMAYRHEARVFLPTVPEVWLSGMSKMILHVAARDTVRIMATWCTTLHIQPPTSRVDIDVIAGIPYVDVHPASIVRRRTVVRRILAMHEEYAKPVPD